MASISETFFLFLSTVSISFSLILSATIIEDLNNLQPPPDFNTTLTNNCLHIPSLRYCNATPFDLPEIFKSTIVASHLCNESKNPNCVESFPKIDLRSRPKIAPLYLSFNFFWKYCPLTILTIDLSNNSLKGSFPSDIFHCSQIQALDLSHNDLSEDVPIQNFSLLTNLTFLNLSYNHFSESKISDSQFFKQFNSSSFLHSGLLPDHRKFRIKAILLLLGFPILIILMVVCLCWLCFWRPDFLPRVLRSKHKFTPSMLKAVWLQHLPISRDCMDIEGRTPTHAIQIKLMNLLKHQNLGIFRSQSRHAAFQSRPKFAKQFSSCASTLSISNKNSV